jgi:hypothetical protein
MQFWSKEQLDGSIKFVEKYILKWQPNSTISEAFYDLEDILPSLPEILFFHPIYYPKVLISKKDDLHFYVRIKKEEVWTKPSNSNEILGRGVLIQLLKMNQIQTLIKRYNIIDDVTIRKTKYFSFLVKVSDIPKGVSVQEFCEQKATKYVLKQLFPDIPHK